MCAAAAGAGGGAGLVCGTKQLPYPRAGSHCTFQLTPGLWPLLPMAPAACCPCCLWPLLPVAPAAYGPCCLWPPSMAPAACGPCCLWSLLPVVPAARGPCCPWPLLPIAPAACGPCCPWSLPPVVPTARGPCRPWSPPVVPAALAEQSSTAAPSPASCWVSMYEGQELPARLLSPAHDNNTERGKDSSGRRLE